VTFLFRAKTIDSLSYFGRDSDPFLAASVLHFRDISAPAGSPMANPAESNHIVRFGEFELDLRTGELRANGHHIILQEKPFQVLTALLERPGEMVAREELIKRLWPAGTFVDFNLGLNKAVNRLREALDDTAERPRFIETFPKRGYRFVARVNRNGTELAEASKIEMPPAGSSGAGQPAGEPQPARRLLFPLGVILGVACLLATWLWIRHRDAKPLEPTFQRLSFGRGMILSARFAPDGESVIYGAAWDGKPFQLFWTRIGSSESRSLGVDADILAISPSGEMAVLLDQHFGIISRQGTLALMSLTSSAPRKLLDNVQDADWSPDGSKLVVTHYVGGHCALEFPPGKVLYQSTGGEWMSHPRVSPQGDQIAFLEHPLGRDDDAGYVAVIDLAGHKKTLSRESGSISGLAWDPAGDAIWFSGSEPIPGVLRALFKVTTGGQQRLVRRESNNLALHDVSRDGHLLMTRHSDRGEVFGRIFPENKERELGWRDSSYASDLSADGATLLLSVQGESSGTGYEVYLRKTDGSPAVRLGDGLPQRFSPDGKWALTIYPWGIRPTAAPQLLLLPTGAGQPVTLTHDSVSHHFPTLLPNGKTLLFEGSEPGRPLRNWIQDVTAGKPLPITPEGTVGKSVSADGKLLVASDQGQKFWLYPTDGGTPKALSGIEPEEETIRWSADGKNLFVANYGIIPTPVYQIEVITGRRKLVYNLAPSDATGLCLIDPILLTPDGKSYVYSDYKILSDLYVASGMR
jgi:DNA-binding winged helix-turn-helix (wHTH) protein/Tol biopolymer transport system component